MALSLFRSGLIPRLVGAIGFAAAAFGTVALLREPPRAEAARSSPPPHETAETTPPRPGAAGALTLEIESVQPIARWSVRLDGETPSAARAGLHRWSADIAPGAALLAVEATPSAASDLAAENRPNALRLRLHGPAVRSLTSRLEWLEPGATLLVPFDELRVQSQSSAPAP